MAIAARERLARILRGDAEPASSVAVTARPEDLNLEVEGFGRVSFPVTPAKARKLIALGQPARFGRGEQTLADKDVRDTWEIPRHLVRAEWNAAMLQVILATVREELGLPNGAEVTADLHSLLVYEPGQFFVAHQDSEKDNSMVGTVVVTLPSNYTGGELLVRHKEDSKAYRGSNRALSLVAFYADCQHEVLPVTSGYRVTLTYNLLVHGDTSRREGTAETVSELAALLREHFTTPVPQYWSGPLGKPPNRLVYLLDHEYTPRALAWTRLKGADARRVPLLRFAAARADCEAVLALADIKTSHSAFAEDEGYGYGRRWDRDEEYGGDEDDGDRNYDIQEFIDSEVTLTHWTGPDGKRLEETSLFVSGAEVCASTDTGNLVPYSSEYEGYMGNWGNTLDRWYHRAAVVLWPREQAFANRAETSPSWALDELAAIAEAGEAARARTAAATLAPFWDGALRAQAAVGKGKLSGLFGKALRTAEAMTDEETAAMLLRPFQLETLTGACADSFGTLVSLYGVPWMADLLRTWFGGRQDWGYGGWQDRSRWVAEELTPLCDGLHATEDPGTAAASCLLDLTWEWLCKTVDAELTCPSPSRRATNLGNLGGPLGAVLTAAAAIGSDATRETVCAHTRKQEDDTITALEIAALRVGAEPGRDTAFGELAAECASRLRERLARPERAAGDWSIQLAGCTCELCGTLRHFLAAPDRRSYEWPLAKPGRQHIHSRIDTAELPVTHVTRRAGRPYVLVLTKTEELFTRDRDERARDQADLAWLAANWSVSP